jgi:hypothetical protein
MSRKFALVIGNTRYDDPTLAQLRAPQEDVNDLAEVLRAVEIGGFESVTSLVDRTSADIRLEIESFFAERRRDDLLMLYFSGHGVRDDQGHLYLAVRDTRHNRLRATGLPAAFVTEEMDRSASRRQVLILDCCHSGAFAQGAKGVLGQSVGTAAAFEGVGYGRVVLTATDSTQYAWEGDQVIGQADNSVFTHFLVEGLRSGAADLDADGRITLDELYSYVYEQVVVRTPRQTPGKWSYRQQGELVIALNPRPVVRPTPLPSDLVESLADARPWVREGAVRELERMLNGSAPGLALSAGDALRRIAADDDSLKVRRLAAEALTAHEARHQAEAGPQAQAEAGLRAAQQAAAERAEAERRAAQQAEDERRAREQAEARRLAKEAADRLAAQKADEQRRAREQAEAEGKAQQAERERQAREQAEAARQAAERLAAQQAEAERQGRAAAADERPASPQADAVVRQATPDERPPASQWTPARLLAAIPWAQAGQALLIIVLGLGLGYGLGQAVYLLLITSFSEQASILLSWTLSAWLEGAAVTLALRRVEPALGRAAAWLIVGAWALGGPVAVLVADQVLIRTLSWDWDVSWWVGAWASVLLRNAAIALALWGPGLRSQWRPALVAVLGFSGAWYLAEQLIWRDGSLVDALAGWIKSIGAGAIESETAFTLAEIPGRAMTGALEGVLGGVVLLGAIYWARRQGHDPAPNLERLEAFFGAIGGPLRALALGLGAAITVSGILVGFVFIGDAGGGWEAVAWLIGGGLSGAAVVWSLRGYNLSLKGAQPALITGIWAVGALIGIGIDLANRDSLGVDESTLTGLAVTGIIGGVGTCLALNRAGRLASGQRLTVSAGAWAAAWAFSALIGLSTINAIGDTPSLTSALSNWTHIDSAVAPFIDVVFYSLCLGGAAALAGALGGGVMFWQLSRSGSRAETR